MKIIKIFSNSEKFREAVVLITKENVIRYLKIIKLNNSGLINFLRNKHHEPNRDVLKIFANVFGYSIFIQTLKNNQLESKVYKPKISYKIKQKLKKSVFY